MFYCLGVLNIDPKDTFHTKHLKKKLTLQGLKCPQEVRVEHKICRTICGTPVQAIWDHKDLTELAWGVREGQTLPQNGLNLALELSRGTQIGQ